MWWIKSTIGHSLLSANAPYLLSLKFLDTPRLFLAASQGIGRAHWIENKVKSVKKSEYICLLTWVTSQNSKEVNKIVLSEMKIK